MTIENRSRGIPPEAAVNSTQSESHGRLKIFLGAAPGVGKTYAMLEAGVARQQEGVDVVAGIIETHGRPETEELLAGLEVLPRRRVEYREQVVEELDLDGLLARQPGLALVDELAHTNVAGSRHPKRYHDVQELLDSGIDVYTTVNIQHLESLNDVVAQITSVRVRETIPDWLLERADEIELIDLSPESLMQRLHEGKVHVPDQSERAIKRFFRPGNLSALRELALRRTAERVDNQMRIYMQTHAISGPWPASDQIMVCVSESPLSSQLVRTARRMADRRRARWMAVYVETPRHYRLTDAERDRVTQTLRLAEQLGGEVVRIPGDNVAEDLLRYARTHNVTELIIGKSLRSTWDELWRGSVVHRVIRRSGSIDVFVITASEEIPAQGIDRDTRRTPVNLSGYAISTLIVAAVGVLAKALASLLPVPDLSIVFLIAVLTSALRWGLGVSIYAAILSVLVYDFFFVEPLHTLSIANLQDVLALIAFLAVAVLVSNLTVRVRLQAESARQREGRTAALYALTQQLARAPDLESLLQAVVDQVAEIMNGEAVVLLPEGDQVALRAASRPSLSLNEHEQSAATWTWQRSQPAGRGSDTLPSIAWLYVPLCTANETVGVLGVNVGRTGSETAPDERRLLEALADQAAVAIQRATLAQDMARARVLAETEHLRTALLSSISHDLRTPLASVIGATSSLLTYDASYDEADRTELLQTILEEAERLNRFVGNLLDMTRLESGALQLKQGWAEVQDLIGSALTRLASRLEQHQVKVSVEPDLAPVQVDFVLMEQVLVNLVENAAKYSPAHSTIRVSARSEHAQVVIEVADEGIGVPEADLERIFDKFYRVLNGDSHQGGTGLGLSICRGIVEAHGGRISAHRRQDGPGTVLTVRLPAAESPVAYVQREAIRE